MSPACSRPLGAHGLPSRGQWRETGGLHGCAFQPGTAIFSSSQSSSSEELVHARLAAGVLRGKGELSTGVSHAVCPEGQGKGFTQSFVQNTESNL